MDIRSLMVDPDTSRDGVWEDYVSGIRVQLARWFNPVHEAAHQRLYTAASQGGAVTLTAEQQDAVDCQAMAEGVLKNWTGIDEDGKPVVCTVETAARYLADPRLVLFRKFCERRAMNVERYRLAAVTSAAGN